MNDIEINIGNKIIKARPMTYYSFLENIENVKLDSYISDNRQGYLVIYPNNYHMWFPKDMFEQAYNSLTMNKEILADVMNDFYKEKA